MKQQAMDRRIIFLKKRIAYLQAELDGIHTGVRSSGAGQYERDIWGRMIDFHEAELKSIGDYYDE